MARFSSERLAPYLAVTGSDPERAVALYAWNADLSAALATTIGHVEVLLRNAMHESLAAWSERQFNEPRWFVDPSGLLHPRAAQDIRAARDRASRGPRGESSGRVVAELSFGFWRFLLAGHYDRSLWRQALFRAFPERRRREVHDAARILHLARNRLAHHEPMFNRPVGEIRSTALSLARWICPVTGEWISRHCRVTSLTGRRPTL